MQSGCSGVRLPSCLRDAMFLWLLLLECQALELLDGLKMPRGIALDLEHGRMYWAEDGSQSIRSATLDGQDVRDVIVKTQVQEAPRDVAIDAKNGKAAACGSHFMSCHVISIHFMPFSLNDLNPALLARSTGPPCAAVYGARTCRAATRSW